MHDVARKPFSVRREYIHLQNAKHINIVVVDLYAVESIFICIKYTSQTQGKGLLYYNQHQLP